MYGQGVYFAADFNYSAQKTYSPPDANGVKYVFQCRVLTGQFVVGSSNMKEPPQLPGSKFRYDSVTNDVNNPRIFVIFKDTQAYPEYLVCFKAWKHGTLEKKNIGLFLQTFIYLNNANYSRLDFVYSFSPSFNFELCFACLWCLTRHFFSFPILCQLIFGLLFP